MKERKKAYLDNVQRTLPVALDATVFTYKMAPKTVPTAKRWRTRCTLWRAQRAMIGREIGATFVTEKFCQVLITNVHPCLEGRVLFSCNNSDSSDFSDNV
jgi:hypothetical protein